MSTNFIYTPDIPQGSQQINQTTNPINSNFQYIYELLATNHVAFNTVDDFGKHKFITYYQQPTDFSTGSTDIGIYSKLVNTENGLELFYRYPNNGAVVQLTGSPVTESGNSGGAGSAGRYAAGTTSSGYKYAAGSWCYTAAGILILTGGVKTTGSTFNAQIPAISGVPAFSQNPFNIVISSASLSDNSSGGGWYSVNITSSSTFTIYSTNSSGINVNWMAIGV